MKHSGMMADHWKAYAETAVPHDASPEDIAAIRHGFYMGAVVIMVTSSRLFKDDVPMAKARVLMDGITDELNDFLAGRPESSVTH